MKYRKLIHKYKYQLMYSERHQVNFAPPKTVITKFITFTSRRTLYVNRGYCWDGATAYPDFKWIMTPSLVHDAFCQLNKLGLISDELKAEADKLLREMCKERLPKCFEVNADVVYFAVTNLSTPFMKKTEQIDKIYEVK